MSENRAIVRGAGLVGGLTLASRIAGLARDVVIGALFGSTAAADAFFVAFRIPNLSRRLVAEGAAGAAFVPVFAELLATRSRAAAVRAARALLTATVGMLGILTILGTVLAPAWVPFLAPGFAAEPGQIELTARLTRWLFPYVFLVGLVALLGALLNALRHFLAPALSPVLLNLAIIAAALFLSTRLDVPVFALACGVLIGGLLQVGAQLLALRRLGIRFWPSLEIRHPALRRVGLLLLPTLFGTAVYQLNVIVNTVLASALPRGSVSFLWYADRVFEFPLGLFAVALGTAALPSFSAQAARRAYDEMRQSVVFAMGIACFVAVPAAVGLLVLADPIVRVLFERGSFGAREVSMTAGALRMYALGLWAVSTARVVVPAFYALGDTRTPVLVGGAAFVANVVFSLMFMGPVGANAAGAGDAGSGGTFVASLGLVNARLGVADLRHAGLALASSLAATLNVLLLLIPLRRRLQGFPLGAVLAPLGRSVVAALLMALALVWFDGLIEGAHGGARQASFLMFAIAGGAGVYAAAAHVLGAPETRALLGALRRPASAGRTR